MHIKSIVLDGFKSYGQRTEINGFDEEFNAITGLNGSGKSNVLDSICFVLGITNLSQVRAGSLQDLIFKNGQAGVTKATVSITFDNTNRAQCPPGFENFDEITITRQIALGGKNKYMINGSMVQNKRVQDLFCSVQLNVNNPHFLIMQGRITKVLNMKPPEILSMIEEAAGTRMYETKRQITQKTLDKKNAKLAELEAIFNEEVAPKLEKLRQQRTQFFEYQRLERELEHMTTLFQAYEYYASQKNASNSAKALKEGEAKVQSICDTIKSNKKAIDEIQREADIKAQEAELITDGKLKEIETKLKEKEKIGARAAAAENGAKQTLTSEEKKQKELEKNFADEEATIKQKKIELSELENLFQQQKENDTKNAEELAKSQKKYEAMCSGMEVNEQGEAQTLKEQLTCLNHEAAQANTEYKQATIQLQHFKTTLKDKEKDLGNNASDCQQDEVKLRQLEKEVAALNKSLGRINYSDERMKQLQHRRNILSAEIRQVRERVENFEASKPFTRFRYADPTPNFNKDSVYGVVCNLVKLKDTVNATAVETAAGGKLYNVAVNTDVTSKSLLKNGRLQQRTTFIPLNKMQAGKIDDNVVKFAKNLVSQENVDPALALISYERHLQPAMEYVFGNVFICKDMNTAKQVAFHDRIRRRCVTLEGDVVDPSGTLSGGARQKSTPILLQLQEIHKCEQQLLEKEHELGEVENEIRSMAAMQEQWAITTRELNLQQHELEMTRRRLEQTTHHQQQEEVNKLKETIAQLSDKVKSCKQTENNCSKKIQELESRMNDDRSHEKLLKEAKAEMEKLKQKADKSGKEWKKHELEQKTLNLEITELAEGLEKIQEQLKVCAENIVKYKQNYEESQMRTQETKETVAELLKEFKSEKAAISEKNRDVQKMLQNKEKLISDNAELELEIKRQQHDIKKLEEDYKISKSKVEELENLCKTNERSLKDAEELTDKDASELEKKIRSGLEKKKKLGRTINPKAQSMYDHEEKQYNELRKRIAQVNIDNKKLHLAMADLDKKKKEVINLAYNQVTKDFGSIFGTLLPGANAKLKIPDGQTILNGLEIKVSFGGEWKESLNELSGGQRSLAALSLILAMLLFKPAPLYILDEVDAALDLSHTQNIGSMLKSHFKQSQFIIVSLKDGMFNNANVLFKTQFVDGMSVISKTVNRN